MTQTPSEYIHGTDPEEQRRLSRLNDILNARSLRELAPRRGESILDLGCGLAQLTRMIARAAGPGARVVGVDRSEEQLAEARRQAEAAGEAALVELRAGDVLALSLSPDEWGSFDLAHTRFLLEHVHDPLTVVRAMVRAVKPGGRVVLEDEDHDILRLWPDPAGAREVWHAYIESYLRAGNDPHVGKRLVELLHAAGAEPRRSTWIYFGGCAGDPIFPALVDNIITILRGAKAAILEGGTLDDARFEAAIDALREWGSRPDAVFWYAMAWAEGVRPS